MNRSSLLLLILMFLMGMNAFEPQKTAPRVPQTLQPFAEWIGGWRGVAQPVRGSSRGAWSLKGDWLWDFSQGDTAELVYQAQDGRQMSQIRIVPKQSEPGEDSESPTYDVELVNQSGHKTQLTGTWEKEKFIAQTTSQAEAGLKLTIRPLHTTRLLLLLEQQAQSGANFQRVVEFGLTREGIRLADRDSTGPECVVTGGEGTIAVMHEGKTYYVCCTGCKQAFERDPAGILQAYFEKKQTNNSPVE